MFASMKPINILCTYEPSSNFEHTNRFIRLVNRVDRHFKYCRLKQKYPSLHENYNKPTHHVAQLVQWLDWGLDFPRVDFFFDAYTILLIERVTGILLAEVNQLFCEADHLPLSSPEVKNGCSPPPVPLRLHGVHKENFTFTSTSTLLFHP